MKKKTLGIIFIVIGVMAAIGSIPNKLYEKLANGPDLSNIVTLLLIIAFIVVGVVFVIKDSKKND